MRKAAIVIGVDRTGGLPELESAAKGARGVARWLEGEGFDVTCLTDARGPVTAAKVEKAVLAAVVPPGRYRLLVVYFSGHGYYQGRSDVWLLSGAPVTASQAIDLGLAIERAALSGIPNVVFISDACRTLAESRPGTWVTGVPAFPSIGEISTESKIDWFKATGVARPAYEAKIDGSVQSILTAALLSAYVEPEPQMVLEVDDGSGTPVEVVPNRRLEGYLQRKVDELLSRADATAAQPISVSVPSSDETYIGRVRRGKPKKPPPRRPGAKRGGGSLPDGGPLGIVSVGDAPQHVPQPEAPIPASSRPNAARAARSRVDGVLSTRGLRGDGDDLMQPLDADTEARVARLGAEARAHLALGMTGFVVQGAAVWRAVAAPSAGATIAVSPAPDNPRTLVRVSTASSNAPGTSIGLQFGDGRAAVLPALRGFVGHVTVGPLGIDHVRYVPVEGDANAGALQARLDATGRLGALVALALDGESSPAQRPREAEALVARLRTAQAPDPTLAVYAAHMLAQGGRAADLQPLLEAMRAVLRADLFDLRLLASRRAAGAPAEGVPLLPFCPLLTQAWSVLAGRDVQLPEALRDARGALGNSLWSTFVPAFADRLMAAIAQGALT